MQQPNNVPNLTLHKIPQSDVDLYYQTLPTKIDLKKSCTLLKKYSRLESVSATYRHYFQF